MTEQERIVGAMLGLACGDALGAPAEFQSQETVRARFGRLTEMVGGGGWEPGEWTDDTGMALCVAEGILDDPDDPVAETGGRFLEWRKTAKDVGSTISAALSAYRGDWARAAQDTPQARSGKAAGNGSLMRTLPVALAYHDEATMAAHSARLSAMTHWDPQAEVCCLVYCLWVRHLLAGEGRRPSWRSALVGARQLAERGRIAPDTPGPSPLPPDFWERLEDIEGKAYEALQPSGYAGYVVECLEAAVWCVLHGDGLEDALVRAVNLAGEADTIAAVAGGAAGAHWGTDALPARWVDALHERQPLKRTAERLADLRRHQGVYATPDLPPFVHRQVQERLFTGRNPLTARDVETLTAIGITHILDLREEREWTSPKLGQDAIDALRQSSRIVRKHIVVGDMRAPTADALDEGVAYLQDCLAAPTNRVYLHCRAGRERTGAMLLAFLSQAETQSPDDLLPTLREFDIRPLPHQLEAVRAWLQTPRCGEGSPPSPRLPIRQPKRGKSKK